MRRHMASQPCCTRCGISVGRRSLGVLRVPWGEEQRSRGTSFRESQHRSWGPQASSQPGGFHVHFPVESPGSTNPGTKSSSTGLAVDSDTCSNLSIQVSPRCRKVKNQSSCSSSPFTESNTKTHHKSEPQPPGSQPGASSLHHTLGDAPGHELCRPVCPGSNPGPGLWGAPQQAGSFT